MPHTPKFLVYINKPAKVLLESAFSIAFTLLEKLLFEQRPQIVGYFSFKLYGFPRVDIVEPELAIQSRVPT